VAITRSLGLDVGDRRIGAALSDPEGILASPLTIIERSDDRAALAAIIDIINTNQVGQIIVGLPLSRDGSIGQQAEKVMAFARELGKHTDVSMDFRDEILSTVEANRLMRETGKGKRKGHDDDIAAAVILQGYLEEGR